MFRNPKSRVAAAASACSRSASITVPTLQGSIKLKVPPGSQSGQRLRVPGRGAPDPKGGTPVKVAWFPGPAGAGWVEAGNTGFQEAVKAGAIEVVDTKYGDTGKEAQLALLERRLQDGFANSCDLAMMGALPGSISQRNAERHGFRIAYTRTKWSNGQGTVPGTDPGTDPGTGPWPVP